MPRPAGGITKPGSRPLSTGRVRARSSAGEHCVDIAGVAGSIPAAPTIFPFTFKRLIPVPVFPGAADMCGTLRKPAGRYGQNAGSLSARCSAHSSLSEQACLLDGAVAGAYGDRCSSMRSNPARWPGGRASRVSRQPPPIPVRATSDQVCCGAPGRRSALRNRTQPGPSPVRSTGRPSFVPTPVSDRLGPPGPGVRSVAPLGFPGGSPDAKIRLASGSAPAYICSRNRSHRPNARHGRIDLDQLTADGPRVVLHRRIMRSIERPR